MLYPDAVNMFYRSLWQYLPSSILKLTRFTPSRVYARCRRMNAAFAKIGQPLYFSNAGEPLASREGKKDLMSVLRESRVAYVTVASHADGRQSEKPHWHRRSV